MNYRWDCFEDAATRNFAKSVVENGFIVTMNVGNDMSQEEL